MVVKAVIFDLFGTLTCIASPEWRIIGKWKLGPEKYPALVKAVCGQKFQNWDAYLDKVVEAAGIENSEENRGLVREIVDSSVEEGMKNIFPEAKTVLQGLKEKGYTLGIVSDCYPHCRKILEENKLLGFFQNSAVILSYEVGMTKQGGPEIFRHCLGKLGVPAEEAVMVGDNPESDIVMSSKATEGKICRILILANPSSKEKDAGFIIVSSLAEVPKAVESLG
jgi:HAD superfamily hydrolase (TIGR01549 family)